MERETKVETLKSTFVDVLKYLTLIQLKIKTVFWFFKFFLFFRSPAAFLWETSHFLMLSSPCPTCKSCLFHFVHSFCPHNFLSYSSLLSHRSLKYIYFVNTAEGWASLQLSLLPARQPPGTDSRGFFRFVCFPKPPKAWRTWIWPDCFVVV